MAHDHDTSPSARELQATGNISTKVPTGSKPAPAIRHPRRRVMYRRRTVSQNLSRDSASRQTSKTCLQQSSGHQKNEAETSETWIVVPTLRVPPSVPIDWLLTNSVTILVHHLLYSRGLLPLSVPQLQQEVADPNTKFSTSFRRHVRRLQHQLDQWTTQWHQQVVPMWHQFLLQKPSPNTTTLYVLLAIGPSFARTREYYMVPLTVFPQSNNGPAKIPSPLALARRLIPSLLTTLAKVQLPPRNAASFQLFTTIWMDQLFISSLDEMNIQSTWIPRPALDAWNPHMSCDIPTRSSRPPCRVTIPLQQTPHSAQPVANTTAESQMEVPTSSLPSKESGPAGQWMSLSASIKGFRM